MPQQKLIVASSKGGVGKSSVTLGLAHAYANAGRRVLLFDLDFSNRCLDLLCRVADCAIYNIADAAGGICECADAVYVSPDNENISVVCAPPSAAVLYGKGGAASADGCFGSGQDLLSGDIGMFDNALRLVSYESLFRTMNAISASAPYDIVICDMPAGIEPARSLARDFADRAIIVASHQPTSIRAAENTSRLFDEAGCRWMRLVISAYEPSDAYREERAGIIDIIDASRLKAIGVVPYDRKLMLAQEEERLPDKNSLSSFAFRNIMRRLEGEQVRLFSGMKNFPRARII